MDKKIIVKKGLVFALLSCCLILSETTFAIDKDKHPIVTEKAINAFNQCLKYIYKEKYKISMIKGGEISLYTKLEDEEPVCDRASNWHFHDEFHGTEHSLKSPYFVMRPSLHKIFSERVQALSYVDNPADVEIDYDVYLNETKEQISGRIIHYIQDMGVPAHVSPIYHSKPEGWFQELIVPNDPDSFDSLFTETNINSLGSLKINKQSCKKLYEKSQKKSMSLVKVLDDFAAKTRNKVIKEKIKEKIPPESNNKSWEEIFWPIRTRDNNYENDKFAHAKQGKNGFLKRHDNIFSLPSEGCKKNNNVYCDFFKDQYLSVRDNTVLALMMIYIK